MKLTFFLFVLSALLLGGCAIVTPTVPSTQNLPRVPWPVRQQQLQAIKQWQVQGAIGVQQAQQGGSATFWWRQQGPELYQLELTAPLGLNSLGLIATPGRAQLTTGNGKIFVAPDAATLLAAQGWQLPVAAFYYWLRGLPAPGTTAELQFDQAQRLQGLSQQGFEVRYLEYMRVGEVELPKKLELSNPTLRARLVLRQWQI